MSTYSKHVHGNHGGDHLPPSGLIHRDDGTVTRQPEAPRSVRENVQVPATPGVYVQTVELHLPANDLRVGDETPAGTVFSNARPSRANRDVIEVGLETEGGTRVFWAFHRSETVDVERTITAVVHLGAPSEPRRCSEVPHDPALCHDGCDPF